ncbi:MAG: hypothetical protein K5640_09505 [Treponema sp.]|nr:hypothetical protein [Treponema sp.]
MAEVGASAEDKIPATFSDTAPDVEMFPVHKMICESAGVPPQALSDEAPPARLLHERKVIEITAEDKASARRTDLFFNLRRLFVLCPILFKRIVLFIFAERFITFFLIFP